MDDGKEKTRKPASRRSRRVSSLLDDTLKKKFLATIETAETDPYISSTAEAKSIEDVLAEREELKNEGIAQDIELKRTTLYRLFVFLGIETAVIFGFAFLQGSHLFGFALEEWSFKLLLAATLLQITYMLQVAVKHLFPTK